MAFAVANTATDRGNNFNTLTVPTTTVNNLLLLMGSVDHGGAAPAPTGGGTWAGLTVQNYATDNQDVQLWWAICTGAVTSIAVAGGADTQGAAWAYAEFSGAATSSVLDVSDATMGFTTGTDFSSTAKTGATVSSQTATCHVASSQVGTIQIILFKALSGTNELVIGGYGGTHDTGFDITATGAYAIASHGGVDAMAPGVNGATGSAAIVWLEATGSGGPITKAGLGIIGP